MGTYLCTSGAQIDRFIELAEARENVILDISGVVLTWKVAEAVRRIGSKRVTFGVDGPHPYPDLATFARSEVQKVQALALSDAQKEDVFWNTIAAAAKLE